jgi:hypothetical protein
MHRLHRLGLAVVLTGGLLTASGVAALGQASTPAPPSRASLNGVDLLGPMDGWAVGDQTSSRGRQPGRQTVLAEHWDGSTWSATSLPSEPAGSGPGAVTVAGSSPADVWTIGTYSASAGGLLSFIDHWDGSSWSRVPVPNPSGPHPIDVLQGLSVRTTSDAWSVGEASTKPWILHWNGTAWQREAFPTFIHGDTASLFGVADLGPHDVWVTGTESAGASGSSLLARWNGTRWTREPVPADTHRLSVLTGLSMSSPRSGFATGYSIDTRTGDQRAIALRWDGVTWAQTPVPPLGAQGWLQTVSSTSGSKAWAVGQSASGPVVLHWTGSSWSEIATPRRWSEIEGVSVLSATRVAVVGSTLSGGPVHAIWDGAHWHG